MNTDSGNFLTYIYMLKSQNSFFFYQLSVQSPIVYVCKVEKVQEDSLDLIPSPLPSVKIQIIDGKVYLR